MRDPREENEEKEGKGMRVRVRVRVEGHGILGGETQRKDDNFKEAFIVRD